MDTNILDYNFYHAITAIDYYNRSKECFELSFIEKNGAYLFYSAFELRSCIERMLVEYLILMDVDDKTLDKLSNTYRIKELKHALQDVIPDFAKRFEFAGIYCQAINFPILIEGPDIDMLNKYYGKLGMYLHHLKDPRKTVQRPEWWNQLISCLKDSSAYVFSLLKNRGSFRPKNKLRSLYTEFREGKLSPEQLLKQIREDI